ncbi:hypothetical protein WN55_04049 [Dufourea novaeangliae]|uniref:Uncharacterized protein n=1 Tax=Dufourea novaeangliae TaxID=178035 RepID=A0A154NX25_DUFNO|nr:hypothetical protein WN55_04049 [Dufourea novaeangliae]
MRGLIKDVGGNVKKEEKNEQDTASTGRVPASFWEPPDNLYTSSRVDSVALLLHTVRPVAYSQATEMIREKVRRELSLSVAGRVTFRGWEYVFILGTFMLVVCLILFS